MAASRAIPRYRQIANKIKADIEVGRYPENSRLPGELELCGTFDASRITVRRALDELSKQGYCVSLRGRGTFVRQRNILRVLQRDNLDTGLFSYSESCRACGHVPGATGVICRTIKAPLACQEFFGIDPASDVLRVERIRTSDGIPVLIEANCYHGAEFEFLAHMNLEDLSLFDLLEKRMGSKPILRESCSIAVVEATVEMANRLQIAPGEPLFSLCGRYFNEAGAPYFYGEQYIVGSRYSFTV